MIRRALHLSIRSFADSRARNIDLHRARFRGWMILFLGNDSPSADERRRRWPRSRCPPSRPGATCCRQGCGGSCLASRGMKRHCRQNARSRSSPARGRQSAKRGCDCCWDSGASTRSSWPSCPPPRKTSTTSGCGPRGASILREKAKERERERENPGEAKGGHSRGWIRKLYNGPVIEAEINSRDRSWTRRPRNPKVKNIESGEREDERVRATRARRKPETIG